MSEQVESSEGSLAAVAEETPAMVRFHVHLLDVYKTMSTEFAKAVMLLSGGTLVISIGFVEKIGPDPACRLLLIFGWLALVVSLGMVAFSMLYSLDSLKATFDKWAEFTAGTFHPKQQTKHVVNLNKYAVGCLCAGLAALSLFAFANIGKQTMTDPKNSNPSPTTKPGSSPRQDSYAVPAPPIMNPAPAQQPAPAPAPASPKK